MLAEEQSAGSQPSPCDQVRHVTSLLSGAQLGTVLAAHALVQPAECSRREPEALARMMQHVDSTANQTAAHCLTNGQVCLCLLRASLMACHVS